MNLQHQLTTTLNLIQSSRTIGEIVSGQELLSLIDLTLLDKTATKTDIISLLNKATQHQVAAICIYPEYLNDVSPELNIKRATVVNFPGGNEATQQVLQTIENTATTTIVHEIDYVFPYPLYLAGHESQALLSCFEAFQLCKQHGLLFKVILETGAFPSPESIYTLSRKIIESGCDFLKTSTGKIGIGASIPAAFAMLSAMIDMNTSCGIKISGGIKTAADALSYIELAEHMLSKKPDSSWFRIGTSTLLTQNQCEPHDKTIPNIL